LKRAAERRKPPAAILVDWPEFNLRLARWFHRRRIPVIYYISPQLWAWRSYRVCNIQQDVDLLLRFCRSRKTAAARRHEGWRTWPSSTGEVCAEFDRAEFCGEMI
jgi:lipid-A-disaccharide synthase